MASWEDEAPDFRMLRESRPRAFKQHSCKARCGIFISVGERHYLFVYLEDGVFKTDRWHQHCWEMSDGDN